ncbi:unnamed protein product [Didymodactylos carnosus]|uniref:G-protein coupled receptors family 1 profile domain-containing protein n=1 Tax=Didymodactylos carnosus TaxID=1234261 RepID=A0A815HGZ5_9BILA|nr:unnamed protein product [Didymodactylos carnosus]CAF1555397.1 unnamed protein product [Didymodactylos carnosus]CAF4221646.1 unnamed protein product [Didymodactylos carnosus]CAF4346154.1 unnamed protein product [Didymodactylos carnosus]
MGIFGLLTVYNILYSQRHSLITTLSIYRRSKTRDYRTMTLMQTIFVVILTIPFGIFNIYDTSTSGQEKSDLTIEWEEFASCITRILWFTNDAVGFYIYSLAAPSFRAEFKSVMTDFLARIQKCSLIHKPITTVAVIHVIAKNQAFIDTEQIHLSGRYSHA